MWDSEDAIRVGVSKLARDYKMDHPRRGKALVFNNKLFHSSLDLGIRNGTDEDRDSLRHTLALLGFEVQVFNDKSYKETIKVIKNVAKENHEQYDCLAVCFLSHGEHGWIYAYDEAFQPDRLWLPFAADLCPTLAGKPKLFFIQACRGKLVDKGVTLTFDESTTDSKKDTDFYRIPVCADFLVTYSTVPGMMFTSFTLRDSRNI
ncbi:unnamed protein product, partial [Darwinula stevensoni]